MAWCDQNSKPKTLKSQKEPTRREESKATGTAGEPSGMVRPKSWYRGLARVGLGVARSALALSSSSSSGSAARSEIRFRVIHTFKISYVRIISKK